MDKGGLEGIIAQLLPGGTLTKTDLRVGTSAHLNARAFEIWLGCLSNIETNKTFIRATLDTCVLTRILIPPEESPEDASIK